MHKRDQLPPQHSHHICTANSAHTNNGEAVSMGLFEQRNDAATLGVGVRQQQSDQVHTWQM
jgi:hypothetical protein